MGCQVQLQDPKLEHVWTAVHRDQAPLAARAHTATRAYHGCILELRAASPGMSLRTWLAVATKKHGIPTWVARSVSGSMVPKTCGLPLRSVNCEPPCQSSLSCILLRMALAQAEIHHPERSDRRSLNKLASCSLSASTSIKVFSKYGTAGNQNEAVLIQA